MANAHLFTSESVTEGHPDKISDQISDAILDALLVEDPVSRVACETLVTTGLVVVAGEITTNTYVDIPTLVRKKVSEIGYTAFSSNSFSTGEPGTREEARGLPPLPSSASLSSNNLFAANNLS